MEEILSAAPPGGRTLIAGGTLWLEDGPRRADVLIEAGRVAAVDSLSGHVHGAEVIEAAGLHVLPGFIDVHVHLADRIGRFEIADDFRSGSAVAVCNGITTIASFATQRPGETLREAVARMAASASDRSYCDYTFHLTPTRFGVDEWRDLAELSLRGYSTVKLYTTYRDAGLFTDEATLEVVSRRLLTLGMRSLLHCEDDDTLGGVDPAAVDLSDPFSHTVLRPPRAEALAVHRAVGLAQRTGCPLHVVHVSTVEAAVVMDAARGRAPVTCETAPQYLLLSDQVLRGPDGHRFLCTPPLRSEENRAELERWAAASGFDLFATDHCPFLGSDQDSLAGDIRHVPKGLPGLGALVPLLFELLVKTHGLSLGELALRLSGNPARLLGVHPRKGVIRVGADADLVVIDPYGSARPIISTLRDCHDPWAGRTTNLAVRYVLLRGETVVRDGSLVAAQRPSGDDLHPL